jgi:tRNA threonylcarbamoyladenosine biosynthesis protein TsaB
MPTCIAIDTSTRNGRIAVAAGETVVFAAEFSSQRSHNSQIFAPLGTALDACGGAPARIAVGTGPGSYTGVRIGIAAGLGIAMAHDIPIAGIPSVCFAAAGDTTGRYTVIGDARRDALYFAEIEFSQLTSSPTLIPTADASLPPGVVLSYDPTPPLPDVALTHPSAAKLAVLAATMSDDAFATLAAIPPEPIYLRAPFITQPKKAGKMIR